MHLTAKKITVTIKIFLMALQSRPTSSARNERILEVLYIEQIARK